MLTYLDNNATTPVAPEALEAMRPFLEHEFFNPSSTYESARGASDAIRAARRTIAEALGGVAPDEVLFTSCATESNNAALFGAVRANPARRHVVTTAVEHPAVLEVCRDLARDGLEVDFLPVDRAGRLDPRELVRALRPDTLIVALMHANNETGVVFPVAELARLTKETDPSILFLTDATQTAGKLPIDLAGELAAVDLLAFSGHKLHAPKGVGALFVRRGTRMPAVHGRRAPGVGAAGRDGERRLHRRASGAAVELARATHDDDERRIRRLRDRLEEGLLARLPCVEVNGAGAERLPNTLNLSVHFIEGEGMLFELNRHGICASSGSACTSGSLEPSHVLRAMQVPFTAVHGSVRFSFSRYNTDDDVDRVLEVFPEIVRGLRRLSPYWDPAHDRPRPEAEPMMRG